MQDVLNLEVAEYAIGAANGWLHAHAAVALACAILATLALAVSRRRRG